jgi:predicted SprT family Zn-dependent metalloprotease
MSSAYILKEHDVLENIVIEEIQIKVVQKQRKEYKCGECPAILFSASVLQQHIYVKHQGKRYNCLECGQLFPTKQKCKLKT